MTDTEPSTPAAYYSAAEKCDAVAAGYRETALELMRLAERITSLRLMTFTDPEEGDERRPGFLPADLAKQNSDQAADHLQRLTQHVLTQAGA